MPESIELTINGVTRGVPTAPERSLLVVLREELGLTGAKYGCAVGACGACTVLVDGAPTRACVTPAAEVTGHAVTTIEGLAAPDEPHPVQAALLATGAMQCGYCAPGMVLAAAALLRAHPDPDDAQIIDALDGNICRCCAYPRILTALRRAANQSSAAPSEADKTTDTERLPPGAPLSAHAGSSEPPPSGVSPDGTVSPRTAVAPLLNPSHGPWDLLAPDERDYFELLDDGLVAVAPPSESASGQPGPWQRNGGAWLHVAADGGVVTAFSGKVDVGQDNRTALAMLVAEELSVPLHMVRMVLGDTDVCPFDIGTFGSRSMPDAGQALAATAAAAKQALIAMAATAWEVDPSGLRATDGGVATALPRRDTATPGDAPDPDGAGSPRREIRTASYGELLHGARRIVTATGRAPVSERRTWRTAGQPTRRPYAAAAVRGAKRFTSDLSLPGMLHGKVLRPPAHGATLRDADLRRAADVPGVVVVRDGSFVAVAGPDPVTAAHALGQIDAAWDRAAQPAEQDLARHLRLNPLEIEGWAGPFQHETGDLASSLAAADVQLVATYSTAYIAHVPLEPRAALAEWSAGRLTVWIGTQRPFGVREELARALGVAQADVRVVVPPTGSGFGGKHAGVAAVEAARIARAAGRAVKLQWSREEEFTCGYFRPAAIIDVASGATAGGAGAGGAGAGGATAGGAGAGGATAGGAGAAAAITAWEFININSGAAGILTPYQVPNQRIRYQPARAPLPQGSYRALAATANNFARESHMDELAYELGADPLEFRLRQLGDKRLAAVLRAAAERAGWHWAGWDLAGSDSWSETGRTGRGLGLACGMEKDGRVATCAEVSVTAGGRLKVHRIVTAYECGAVVNPDNVVNQIEGATVMALGGALFEAVHFDDGVILNASLSTYRVPRFSDVPPIEVILLERRDIPPAGAGETPLIAVAPALANAIFAATGRRIRSLPLLQDGALPAPTDPAPTARAPG